jgi:predicted ester cyclase
VSDDFSAALDRAQDVPASGKSFKIMSIDIHTIEDGKIKRSYHVEDWAGAMRQLSGGT